MPSVFQQNIFCLPPVVSTSSIRGGTNCTPPLSIRSASSSSLCFSRLKYCAGSLESVNDSITSLITNHHSFWCNAPDFPAFEYRDPCVFLHRGYSFMCLVAQCDTHACGEHVAAKVIAFKDDGSSPRVWGTSCLAPAGPPLRGGPAPLIPCPSPGLSRLLLFGLAPSLFGSSPRSV